MNGFIRATCVGLWAARVGVRLVACGSAGAIIADDGKERASLLRE